LSPSVRGGLLQQSALPGILFCFASCLYYKSSKAGMQLLISFFSGICAAAVTVQSKLFKRRVSFVQVGF
jgi:hypothetical protein